MARTSSGGKSYSQIRNQGGDLCSETRSYERIIRKVEVRGYDASNVGIIQSSYEQNV